MYTTGSHGACIICAIQNPPKSFLMYVTVIQTKAIQPKESKYLVLVLGDSLYPSQ